MHLLWNYARRYFSYVCFVFLYFGLLILNIMPLTQPLGKNLQSNISMSQFSAVPPGRNISAKNNIKYEDVGVTLKLWKFHNTSSS